MKNKNVALSVLFICCLNIWIKTDANNWYWFVINTYNEPAMVGLSKSDSKYSWKGVGLKKELQANETTLIPFDNTKQYLWFARKSANTWSHLIPQVGHYDKDKERGLLITSIFSKKDNKNYTALTSFSLDNVKLLTLKPQVYLNTSHKDPLKKLEKLKEDLTTIQNLLPLFTNATPNNQNILKINIENKLIAVLEKIFIKIKEDPGYIKKKFQYENICKDLKTLSKEFPVIEKKIDLQLSEFKEIHYLLTAYLRYIDHYNHSFSKIDTIIKSIKLLKKYKISKDLYEKISLLEKKLKLFLVINKDLKILNKIKSNSFHIYPMSHRWIKFDRKKRKQIPYTKEKAPFLEMLSTGRYKNLVNWARHDIKINLFGKKIHIIDISQALAFIDLENNITPINGPCNIPELNTFLQKKNLTQKQDFQNMQDEAIKGLAYRFKIHLQIKPEYIVPFTNSFLNLLETKPQLKYIESFKVTSKILPGDNYYSYETNKAPENPVPIITVYFALIPFKKINLLTDAINTLETNFRDNLKRYHLKITPRFNKHIKGFIYIAGGDGDSKEVYYNKLVKKLLPRNYIYNNDLLQFIKGYVPQF